MSSGLSVVWIYARPRQNKGRERTQCKRAFSAAKRSLWGYVKYANAWKSLREKKGAVWLFHYLRKPSFVTWRPLSVARCWAHQILTSYETFAPLTGSLVWLVFQQWHWIILLFLTLWCLLLLLTLGPWHNKTDDKSVLQTGKSFCSPFFCTIVQPFRSATSSSQQFICLTFIPVFSCYFLSSSNILLFYILSCQSLDLSSHFLSQSICLFCPILDIDERFLDNEISISVSNNNTNFIPHSHCLDLKLLDGGDRERQDKKWDV